MKLYFVILFLCFTLISSLTKLQQSLNATWVGIKERNIDPYNIKVIHRPYSELPNDAASEGVGYGLICALYSDDQYYYDLILNAANTYMWNGNGYDWRIDVNGNRIGTGSATDADEDIAFTLVMAQRLVDSGKWKNNFDYGVRAQIMIDNMWNSRMISYGKNVAPGPGWGGDEFVNPGYFAPAWYRIFQSVDKSNHDWTTVINNCYNTIMTNPGYTLGLIPDWMTPQGKYYGNLGYNTYGDGHYLFKDAIRIYWRIGTDYLWNKDPRALVFLNKAYEFIESVGGAPACNFYQMDGQLVPADDIWIFDGDARHRYRREHSPLTIGMWSIVPYCVNATDTDTYTDELLKYYNDTDYWGLTTGDETIYNNEMYFDQFLAWFGAIILNGTWIEK